MPSFLDFEHGTAAENIYANSTGFALALEFTHMPSSRTVRFKAFLDSWEDSFDSSYNAEQVYGRNDPIVTFQGTTRTISISWKVIAGSLDEAINNIERINLLSKFLYPGYSFESQISKLAADEGVKVGTLAKAPLMKMRFANLIKEGESRITSNIDPAAFDGGLLVALSGLSISAELDTGGFDAIDGSSLLRDAQAGGVFLPKVFTLSTSMTVLHQHSLGWNGTEWQGPIGYPYSTFDPEDGNIGTISGFDKLSNLNQQISTAVADDLEAIEEQLKSEAETQEETAQVLSSLGYDNI